MKNSIRALALLPVLLLVSSSASAQQLTARLDGPLVTLRTSASLADAGGIFSAAGIPAVSVQVREDASSSEVTEISRGLSGTHLSFVIAPDEPVGPVAMYMLSLDEHRLEFRQVPLDEAESILVALQPRGAEVTVSGVTKVGDLNLLLDHLHVAGTDAVKVVSAEGSGS